ncbi:TPA: transporter, partial [Burkholderia stabilis]
MLLSGLAVPAFAADACDEDDESVSCTRISNLQTGAINTFEQSASLFAVTIPAAASEGSTAAGSAAGNAAASGNAAAALGSGAIASGNGAVAVGAVAQATGSSSVAIGVGARALNAVGLIAIGDYSSALGKPSADLPSSRYQNGAGNVALGSSASVDMATNKDATGASVSLGAMSYTNREGVVSVGSSAAGKSFNRQVVNVGAGTQANDAVNVSQITPVVDALGGGAAFDSNTGAVTGPTYALTNGGAQTTVGGALGALDGALTTAKGDIAANASDIANVSGSVTSLDTRVTNNETSITQIRSDLGSGTIGLVQQAGAGADLTVGADTEGSAVNFTGQAGDRKLTGVANGDVAAGSNDVVTGDQLYATNQDVA